MPPLQAVWPATAVAPLRSLAASDCISCSNPLSAKPGGLQVGEHGEHALVELGKLLDNKTVRARLLPLLDSIEEVRTFLRDESQRACLRYAV